MIHKDDKVRKVNEHLHMCIVTIKLKTIFSLLILLYIIPKRHT